MVFFIRTQCLFKGRMEPRWSSHRVLKFVVLGFIMFVFKVIGRNYHIMLRAASQNKQLATAGISCPASMSNWKTGPEFPGMAECSPSRHG
jgi:hypothetical protein